MSRHRNTHHSTYNNNNAMTAVGLPDNEAGSVTTSLLQSTSPASPAYTSIYMHIIDTTLIRPRAMVSNQI